jgi:hypothetical protein
MLCICFSPWVVLSPSQCLNLKALIRTLDKSKVSTIQGVVGGETLVVFLTACVWNARSRSRRAWPSALSSTGGGRGDRMGSISGDCVGSVSGDCVGSFCGHRMGRFYGDRMGSVCGDRVGRFCGDRMGSISGDRVGCLICNTETRSTR